MPTTVVEIVLAVVVAAIGAATGWCLRGGGPNRRSGRNSNEIRYAREVLARLHELATHVAADVGEHTSRVEEINEELVSTAAHETEAVVSAVDKLLQANSQMQQQLASADDRLREQARQIESHAAEARTDPLTQLANRRAFDDEMAHRFAEFQRHARPFSVMMIDVDHFKRFNDAHGHQAGDAVLRGLGEVLRKNARGMDIVARYGGEEFAIIAPGTSVADASSGAERVRRAIATNQFSFRETKLHVTASVGVAESLPEEDVAILIQRADAALYASKEAGRNRVRWHDGREIHPVDGSEESSSKAAGSEDAPMEQPQEETQAAEQEPPPARPPAPSAQASSPALPEARGGDHRGLVDRAVFEALLGRRLEQWKRGGVPPSVLLVRIDDYAGITSGHGEQAAEMVLRATAQLLSAAIPDKDLLASYDSGTFAVLLPGANLASTVDTAERLRTAVERCALPLGDDRLRFTVSVSAAVAIDDDAFELLRRAEEALQAAFESGGNTSYFHNGEWSEIAQATLQRTG